MLTALGLVCPYKKESTIQVNSVLVNPNLLAHAAHCHHAMPLPRTSPHICATHSCLRFRHNLSSHLRHMQLPMGTPLLLFLLSFYTSSFLFLLPFFLSFCASSSFLPLLPLPSLPLLFLFLPLRNTSMC